MIYLDKGFDKIAINFIEIETLYTKCCPIFLSRSKLFNHLKNGCLEMTSPFFPIQAISFISIITFKVIYQFFGSGLAFRDWIYAIALITLTPKHPLLNSNPESIACLDTRCEVTVVDKAWLSKRLSI